MGKDAALPAAEANRAAKLPPEGRRRVAVEAVTPEVDAGRFPIKRAVGETVQVEADIFADGHDAVTGLLLWRPLGVDSWFETEMVPLGNDRWRASFGVDHVGFYCYTVVGWVDRFRTWRKDLGKRIDAHQNIETELLIGAQLVEDAVARAQGADRTQLQNWARLLRATDDAASRQALALDPDVAASRQALALDPDVAALVHRYADRSLAVRYNRELAVWVDRERARYSTWYEFFPRSTTAQPGRHGTFKDCEKRLAYAASMGFDVIYLPPIHPIGHSFRKGRNNSLTPLPDDPGSPWAIGSEEGGHTAIHPALGTIADFERLVARARELNMEIALDLAFQCTPDHPYVKQHPQWFRHRPDGTIQYAENPPKKYQDIYPLDFESEDWRALWLELKRVVLYWVERGVRIFRVDNPHTKAFAFWEWLIAEVQSEYPDVLFLAEAFTRPKVMYRLAKLGFSQSYTYFAWRNTKAELTEYFTELTQTPVREFFRPNLWPNTPDILTEYLQFGGRHAFMIRVVLAATLGANYGIYGPAFELGEHTPREAGSEEYLNSEKYEIRAWDLDNAWSLREFVARVNRIRRSNPALQRDWGLRFHPVDNPMLICYSKATDDLSNVLLVVVNLDVRHTHAGWVTLDLAALGIADDGKPYQVHDELGDSRFLWQGARNYVELTPQSLPAHIFRLRRWVRSERDFDYFV
jgi:starch synthase (maltosyl-transferring)